MNRKIIDLELLTDINLNDTFDVVFNKLKGTHIKANLLKEYIVTEEIELYDFKSDLFFYFKNNKLAFIVFEFNVYAGSLKLQTNLEQATKIMYDYILSQLKESGLIKEAVANNDGLMLMYDDFNILLKHSAQSVNLVIKK